MNEYHILNLGAGIQSTTLFLMAHDGSLKIDHAIFADTQAEPQAVYDHLSWLQQLGNPSIVIRSAGNLAENVKSATNLRGQRFVDIPAFAKHANGTTGRLRRQCSWDYKARVVDQWIRRELLGLQYRQRKPKDVRVYQYFGFSLDEKSRAERMLDRLPHARFPLIDIGMTRRDCVEWLRPRVPHEVPRSACVFCPYRSNSEWSEIRKNRRDWKLATEVDAALREPGNVLQRNMDSGMYVHRYCQPLDQVDFGQKQLSLFDMECEGGCGL